ncbi:hypothetical protein AB1Y20_006542 [Prymnesium parvum]|uniref:Uncharacterized protein n=1 Tax=Prymnesium parvum TaxID=97485 RepID=A0AB34IYR3_PRYPA
MLLLAALAARAHRLPLELGRPSLLHTEPFSVGCHDPLSVRSSPHPLLQPPPPPRSSAARFPSAAGRGGEARCCEALHDAARRTPHLTPPGRRGAAAYLRDERRRSAATPAARREPSRPSAPRSPPAPPPSRRVRCAAACRDESMRSRRQIHRHAAAGRGGGGRGAASPTARPEAGQRVAVVQKAHYATGERTLGVVADVLTRASEHRRGFKVRLTSGVVGRTLEILSEPSGGGRRGESVSSRGAGASDPLEKSSAELLAIPLEDIVRQRPERF